jgi:NAD(P)H-flavin reductase
LLGEFSIVSKEKEGTIVKVRIPIGNKKEDEANGRKGTN